MLLIFTLFFLGVNIYVNDVFFPVSYWTEKGGRPYQEDRHSELKGIGSKDSSLYGAHTYSFTYLLTFTLTELFALSYIQVYLMVMVEVVPVNIVKIIC